MSNVSRRSVLEWSFAFSSLRAFVICPPSEVALANTPLFSSLPLSALTILTQVCSSALRCPRKRFHERNLWRRIRQLPVPKLFNRSNTPPPG